MTTAIFRPSASTLRGGASTSTTSSGVKTGTRRSSTGCWRWPPGCRRSARRSGKISLCAARSGGGWRRSRSISWIAACFGSAARNSDRLLVFRDGGRYGELRADDINLRFRELAACECSVKDLRTWQATVLAAHSVRSSARPATVPASTRYGRSWTRSPPHSQDPGGGPGVLCRSPRRNGFRGRYYCRRGPAPRSPGRLRRRGTGDHRRRCHPDAAPDALSRTRGKFPPAECTARRPPPIGADPPGKYNLHSRFPHFRANSSARTSNIAAIDTRY